MPETNIGLFPDVGGGWFLSRCPGHAGEWLALTGHAIGAADAIALGLADLMLPPQALAGLAAAGADIERAAREQAIAPPASSLQRAAIDRHFAAPTLAAIFESLREDDSSFARDTLAALERRSPLMMAVTLEQLRRARSMSLADDLRMERGLVRHAFALRPGRESETVEGIRAQAIDKDNVPRWNPIGVAEVTTHQVEAFFEPPWPAHAHPLRHLED